VRLIFFHFCRTAPRLRTRQAVSFAADTRPTSISSHSLSNDAIAAFQFRDGLDKNGIFFDDPNLDSSSETTAGAYRILPTCNAEVVEPHAYVPPRRTEWEDESPYPEVRAAVSNTDDIEMPADTLRAWIIGLFWAIFIPGLNQFFHFRYPSVTIGSVRRPFPSYVNPGEGVC